MKTVVFGGSGFLGSHVVEALRAAGHEVRVFDLKAWPLDEEGIEVMSGNILDPEAVRAAVEGCDAVANFAGLADLDDARTKPRETIRLNIEGNLNVLEAIVDAKISRYMFASTIYVYSEKGGFYRCSKQASELYIEEFARKHDVNYTIVRYGTVYGPRADSRNSIWRYLHQALTEGEIKVSGTGEEMREYIDVRDAAELTAKALGEEFSNCHLVLTGHHPIKLSQLMNAIQEIMSNRITVTYGEGKSGDHYSSTPYTYLPKIGRKFTSNLYRDLGQGLLECLHEIDQPQDNDPPGR